MDSHQSILDVEKKLSKLSLEHRHELDYQRRYLVDLLAFQSSICDRDGEEEQIPRSDILVSSWTQEHHERRKELRQVHVCSGKESSEIVQEEENT